MWQRLSRSLHPRDDPNEERQRRSRSRGAEVRQQREVHQEQNVVPNPPEVIDLRVRELDDWSIPPPRVSVTERAISIGRGLLGRLRGSRGRADPQQLNRERAARFRANRAAEQLESQSAANREAWSRRVVNEWPEETEARRRETAERASRQRDGPNRPARRNKFYMIGMNYSSQNNYLNDRFFSIGSMSEVCSRCGSKNFLGEPPGICCSSGKVRCAPIEQPPLLYMALFEEGHPFHRAFITDIRRYNSCFQMTSFGVSGSVREANFMPTFSCQGQIYHRIGSLLPLPHDQPVFLQIYFMGDADIQIDRRCNIIQDVNRNIVALLQDLFDRNNRLIACFKTFIDRMPSNQQVLAIRADRTPAGEHERRFNAPVNASEVGIVMVEGEQPRRDIILQKRDNQLRRIDETHRYYDALQYPVIFWRGQESYHLELKQVNPRTGEPSPTKRLTIREFYAYHFMVRRNELNYVLRCGPLLNQFAVDAFAKAEASRMRFIRLNQAALRVDEYIHLRDAVAADADPANLGRRFILPSSFTGSPRHQHEYAQDALTFVYTVVQTSSLHSHAILIGKR